MSFQDGVEPSQLQHHPNGHFDIPEHIKPDTEKMRVEVCYITVVLGTCPLLINTIGIVLGS